MTVQTSRKQPAYASIAEILRNRILSGDLTPGERLPAERILAENYGVSRMTMRHALEVLQENSLVVRRRGRSGGTFVKGSPMKVEITRMEGIMPQLRKRNLQVDSTVVSAELCRASIAVAEGLEIPEGGPVFNVVRLRSVDQVPLMIEHAYFPADLVPGMLDESLVGSLYELLQAHWGAAPVRKWEAIVPDFASEWEQQLLRVPREVPLLRVTRRSQLASGKFIEYSEDVMRTDVAHIEVYTENR